jgi:flagellar protein FliO/FliZ
VSPTASYLLETLFTLFVVILIAFGVLVGARKLGIGGASGPIRLLGRLPLDARRAIYVVKIGPKVLVVGSSEGGLNKLGELKPHDLPDLEEELPQRTFADVLKQVQQRVTTVPTKTSGQPSPKKEQE